MAVSLFRGNTLPVSVETVVRIIQMLTSTGTLDKFIEYSKDKDLIVTIPADTANGLKQFLDDNTVEHPMARSIMGLQPDDCQDYHCPNIYRGSAT
jgi:hypothetical protein